MDSELKADILWWMCDILDTVDLAAPEVAEGNDIIKRLMEVQTNDDE